MLTDFSFQVGMEYTYLISLPYNLTEMIVNKKIHNWAETKRKKKKNPVPIEYHIY